MFYRSESEARTPAFARRPDGAVSSSVDYQAFANFLASLSKTLGSRGSTL